MSPIDAAIVRRKLGHIMTSLDLLGPMRGIPLQKYRQRVWERKGVERVLQEAIEAALDVNAHLIAELGHDVPDDYFGGFMKLGQLGILSEELAGALAPSAGLRNRLVHEYGWTIRRDTEGAVHWLRPECVRYRAGPSSGTSPPGSKSMPPAAEG